MSSLPLECKREIKLEKQFTAISKLECILQSWKGGLKSEKGSEWTSGIDLQLLVYGSVILKTGFEDADVDATVLVNHSVSTESFFHSLWERLSECSDVKLYRKVDSSKVPLLEFSILGVDVDLVFACLNTNHLLSDLDLENVDVLEHMDPTYMRCILAHMETQYLLKTFPQWDIYGHAVRFLKLWGKQRRIYSEKFGWLSGYCLTLMVLHVDSTLGPYSSAEDLLVSFFQVFSSWIWPRPVRLTNSSEEVSSHPLHWNCKDVDSRLHTMPVLTPLVPCVNTAILITKSNRHVIMNEFRKAHQIIERSIANGDNNSVDGANIWIQTMVKPPSFFNAFPVFLFVQGFARGSAERMLWISLVEAKLRIFAERCQQAKGVLQCCLLPETFEIQNGEDFQASWFFGIIPDEAKLSERELQLASCVSMFLRILQTRAIELGLRSPSMSVNIRHIKRNEISELLPSSSRIYYEL